MFHHRTVKNLQAKSFKISFSALFTDVNSWFSTSMLIYCLIKIILSCFVEESKFMGKNDQLYVSAVQKITSEIPSEILPSGVHVLNDMIDNQNHYKNEYFGKWSRLYAK